MIDSLHAADVAQKIKTLDATLEIYLQGRGGSVPEAPGRDVQVVALRDLPPKAGLSTRSGQARLLHDLANIELQAMELGLRTLREYPQAPADFREQLAAVTREEGLHLKLCLEAIDELGHCWGDWPVHLGLWQAVDAKDDLIDRVLIVHRYMEGSGLDAGDSILNRLSGVDSRIARKPVAVIARDEMDHVRFGSNWFRQLCREQGLDPGSEFGTRLRALFHRIPRRLEKINSSLRKRAGFDDDEIRTLQELRDLWFQKSSPVHQNVSSSLK